MPTSDSHTVPKGSAKTCRRSNWHAVDPIDRSCVTFSRVGSPSWLAKVDAYYAAEYELLAYKRDSDVVTFLHPYAELERRQTNHRRAAAELLTHRPRPPSAERGVIRVVARAMGLRDPGEMELGGEYSSAEVILKQAFVGAQR